METANLTNVTNPISSPGSVGVNDGNGHYAQVGNQPTTVSGAAAASGGLEAGNFIEPDIDDELFKFNSDDTPLMNLMLKAKKVQVDSPEVDHYMIDEPSATVVTNAASTATMLKVSSADAMKLHAYDILSVQGVSGYVYENSSNVKTGKPLQLFVTEIDSSNNVVVKAINGIKTSATDEYGSLPTGDDVIPTGTVVTILGNALYETQKEVDPDLVLPQPTRVYLQKRGMNQIVSDYFDSQKKRIPFSKAVIAEAAIKNFKCKGNRTLWISQKGKFRVKAKKTGDMQYVYNTEGVRWQFKRELDHTGTWTFEKLIALAKMFYTGEDVPSDAIFLVGKNLMEEIQCIDFSKHPEVKIEVKTNELGWKVTTIVTVFGDIPLKMEPTLDRLGYSNSGALISPSRLVHYQRKAESSFDERVEGEEATRSGMLVWDALALKGSCHIWVNGETEQSDIDDIVNFIQWDSVNATTGASVAPTVSELKDGYVYYFMNDYTLPSGTISGTTAGSTKTVENGSMWKCTKTSTAISWTEYTGDVYAN